MLRLHALLFCASSVLLVACGHSALPAAANPGTSLIEPAPESTASAVSRFANSEIIESSGVQRSLRLSGLYWVHNDSGAGPFLYASDAAGNDWGRIELPDVSFSDFEDIAGYRDGGQSWLVAGDVGDNGSSRSEILLYIFAEPAVETLASGFRETISDYQRLQLQYADGNGHDCESLAVDVLSDEILIVTKSFVPGGAQELWTTGLRAALDAGSAVLQRQTAVTGLPPQPDPLSGQLISGPATTAMDIRPDRSELAILTYSGLYIWARSVDESWAQALAREPIAHLEVPADGNNQAEGLGYSGDGRQLLVAAENSLPVGGDGAGSTIAVIARE